MQVVRSFVLELMGCFPGTAGPAASPASAGDRPAFHSFAHAVDALAAAAKLLHPSLVGGQRYLTKVEAWALALATLGSSAGHEGRDDAFQVRPPPHATALLQRLSDARVARRVEKGRVGECVCGWGGGVAERKGGTGGEFRSRRHVGGGGVATSGVERGQT